MDNKDPLVWKMFVLTLSKRVQKDIFSWVVKCIDMSTYDKAFQIKYCTLCKSLPNDISHLEKYFKEKNDCIIYKEGTSSVS